MGIIAKYKFNQEIYADFVPGFNSGFTDYTVTDKTDTDGMTIRTIESDSLPTLMRFGANAQTDREKSLLEVYECDTSNITNMYEMFRNCSSLTSLNVSNFNTEKVTNMGWMFSNCSSLTSLDLSNFNTQNVANMTSMFTDCSSLTFLDVSNFNTEKVTDAGWAFRDCFESMDIGAIYCNSSTINKISDSISTNTTVWYQDANLSDLTQLDNITYKKYKSTTLSLNEPIQLRSIGDVHDEINYETGEYIQRIGEVVFDGSDDENWGVAAIKVDGLIGIGTNIPNDMKYLGSNRIDGFINDRLKQAVSENMSIYSGYGGWRMFAIYMDSSTFDSTQKIKQWLSQNPITVQYQLAQPIITKIDTTILDQNNSYKSSQQTYDEPTYISVQSDTVVTPTSSVDYEIYSSTGTVTGTSATIDNAEAGTPVSGVVYGETLLNCVQDKGNSEVVCLGDHSGTNITIENSVEGNIKNAVVKGDTLINIVNNDNWVRGTGAESSVYTQTISIKKGQTYTVICKMESSDSIEGVGDFPAFRLRTGADNSGTSLLFIQESNVVIKQTFTNNENNTIYLRFFNQKTNYKKLMVIEGDYTNVDIPYFEGMKSVQMPVLTTTGKNLFDGELELGTLSSESGEPSDNNRCLRSKNFINVSPNTSYVFSNDLGYTTLIFQYDKNKQLIIGGTLDDSITTKENTYYVKFRTSYGSVQNNLSVKYQVEKRTQPTPYESYKSNILTVNEDVELRGIGEVKDELDLLTGELTQRIGEVVLDGSEDWQIDSDTNDYRLALALKHNGEMLKYSQSICDKYPTTTGKQSETATNYIYIGSHSINLYENPSMTLEEFKSKLKQNPMTFQYQFTTESVKTVDLSILDQDNTPTTFHSYDIITHINTSSDYLKPTLEITNPTYDVILKPNTEYTIKTNRTNRATLTSDVALDVNLGGSTISMDSVTNHVKVTTPSTLENNTLTLSGFGNKVKDIMVIEGDYVDRDLDFFEGFISVENPILSTTGKNLVFLDKNNPDALGSNSGSGSSTIKYDGEKQAFYTDTHRSMCSNIAFKPNTYYIISAEFLLRKYSSYSFNWSNPQQSTGSTYSSDTPFNETTWIRKSIKRLSNNNGKIGWIAYGGVWFRNLQIEEAESLTEYEPYQGNTLTTYPQITLRSMGDIKDEWDVVGETVTRRIGKIVLDGSEEIRTTNNGVNVNKIVFKEKLYYQSSSGDDCNYLMCDKLRCVKYSSFADRLYDFISIGTSGMTNYESAIYIKFNSATTVDEWKDLYSQITPITLYYQLETPTTESVRITPPNPQTSSASITIPTQLNHVEDTSDFLVWNPYKEHYVRYNYVEDGVVLDNYTWENLTYLNERQFVEFYNRRTYVDQPYHNYVASHGSKGTSKYVLIEPNQDYTVSVRFSELPTCETVKVNLGGTEVEMSVNDPHVHITTPNTLVNNLCSISGDGLDGKVTDILVIHCLEHEGFADIDYFEGIDGIGEIVDNKVSIVMEQTNGNLIDMPLYVHNNGNAVAMYSSDRIKVRPSTIYRIKGGITVGSYSSYLIYFQLYKNGVLQKTENVHNYGSTITTGSETTEARIYTSNIMSNGNANVYTELELCYADMEKDYIRPRYYDKEEILLPMQLHRINTVYDNFYYDEMKGFYRIQQSIGHKYFVGADSENWTLIERGQRVLRFRYNNADIQMKSLGEFMTNILPNGTVTSPYECCAFNGINFIVSIDKERLSSESLTAFKEWLANNNLHLYYQLASPLMIDLPQYPNRIEFNTYKDEIYTFFKNCKPTVFTLGVPLDKTYRFYEYEESQGYANRVELTDERMTDEDTLYINTIHGSGFSNLIENPNNVETLLKPNYQGKAVSHTLTNGKVSSIKVHGFEPNETTIANYNSTLKQYELIVQAQKGQSINTQTLAVPYKLEVYEDGTKDKVYYDEQNKVFRFEGGSVTNPPYNNSYIFNTPLEVFKGIAPRTGLIAEIKVKFNSGTTSARIYYSLDGGATTAYSTLRSMTDEVEYYIGFFNTGGTKLDYATKLSAEAEYINLAPLSSTLPESLIITQIQNISECIFTLDKTYYFDSWIKPLELDVYNGETIITEQSGAIVTINNNGLRKDALTYTDETYTVYWTYVGGEGNVTITLGGTKVEVVGTQGYATLKTAIDGVQDGLIIGGYNLSIKDLMLVKGERIEDLAYFEGSRAVGTAFVDENGETKYKITLVTGSELINDKFENRITFEDNNKHNVVVTKLLGNKPNKK